MYLYSVIIKEIVLKHKLSQKIKIIKDFENWQAQRQRKLILIKGANPYSVN
jgi:hypothetical protein